MPEFTIEMLWDCAVCQAERNGGLERHCRNCGHPKDDRDREYMPENVTVSMALEGDKRRRAEAGPDWKCAYCGSLQNPLNKCCTECGVPQGEKAKKAWDAKTEEATFEPTTGAKTTGRSFTEHVEPGPVATSSVSDRPREDTPAKAYAAGDTFTVPRRTGYLKRVLIAIPCVLALAVLMWLLFRTREVNAHVTAVTWRHDVKIDRYSVYHHDGWNPDPGAFNVRDDGSRVHHYDHVKVGSHNEPQDVSYDCRCKTIKGVCHTTPVKCKPNKNGTASCTGGDEVCAPDTEKCDTCWKKQDHWVDDYEDQPRYQHYYDWDVWEWHYNRTVSHSGQSVAEDWPSADELSPPVLGAGEQEREGGRSTDHHVTFSDGKDTWDITPDACQEFERYPVGSVWHLKIGVAHGVEVLPK